MRRVLTSCSARDRQRGLSLHQPNRHVVQCDRRERQRAADRRLRAVVLEAGWKPAGRVSQEGRPPLGSERLRGFEVEFSNRAQRHVGGEGLNRNRAGRRDGEAPRASNAVAIRVGRGDVAGDEGGFAGVERDGAAIVENAAANAAGGVAGDLRAADLRAADNAA
jgi:hypothetical protein